ncbi:MULTISPECIES: beta-ketoacyl synthase chain length factor [Dyella]|uniref:3-oxoacyl-ACP synthase n=2 Tax=Dyella TaxID=231454 RepID=A0A4R0YTP9_9GAMM|nr:MULTISPECIES: beta-ketoacyl synthase chain length factor [Dyella]TBR39799.1 3-oxoacyl-ACP synthase [Dyella terrae]TCI12622.1 3-oxoacyl-ACP synthase [Dyella soli]
MIDLHIAQWRAWAPSLDSSERWQAWAHRPWTPQDNGEQPACEFLPPMQRRRLSRMARMALEVAWPLCGEDEQLPLVFASRHGETQRTFALLSDVGDGQPLSPTQFGLSVHNAIAGQWSLLRGQHAEASAIAGEGDTFEHAMLEAALMIDAGAPSVIVIMTEERPPAAYDGWIDDVPFSYAVALRVTRREKAGQSPEGHWRLALRTSTSDATRPVWPHALNVLRVLLTSPSVLEHPWKTRQWIWQPIA